MRITDDPYDGVPADTLPDRAPKLPRLPSPAVSRMSQLQQLRTTVSRAEAEILRLRNQVATLMDENAALRRITDTCAVGVRP